MYQDGREIRKWPGGKLEIRQSDGTVITMDTDGVKHTQHTNGVLIESRPDGTKVILHEWWFGTLGTERVCAGADECGRVAD